MKMSEDKENRELKKLAEKERRLQDIEGRIQKGIVQSKEGEHLTWSPDKEQFLIIPRTVDASLNWSHLLERAFENMSFVAQYSYDAFARMVIVILQHIPEEDMDEKFEGEVEKATFKVKIPTGRYGGFGGQTYEIMDEAVEYDHLKILRAMVSLLRRRGLYTLPRLWEEHVAEVFWKRSGKNAPVERSKTVDGKEVKMITYPCGCKQIGSDFVPCKEHEKLILERKRNE